MEQLTGWCVVEVDIMGVGKEELYAPEDIAWAGILDESVSQSLRREVCPVDSGVVDRFGGGPVFEYPELHPIQVP